MINIKLEQCEIPAEKTQFQVRTRLIRSFIPRKPSQIQVSPDLYGPSMIVLTMVALLLYNMKTSGLVVKTTGKMNFSSKIISLQWKIKKIHRFSRFFLVFSLKTNIFLLYYLITNSYHFRIVIQNGTLMGTAMFTCFGSWILISGALWLACFLLAAEQPFLTVLSSFVSFWNVN